MNFSDCENPVDEALQNETCRIPEQLPEDPSSAVTAPTEAIPPKGRIAPAFIIMAVMLAVGFLVYFMTAKSASSRLRDAAQPYLLIEEGILYFDASRYNGNGVVKVPQSVAGQPVTKIAPGCFAGTEKIISVELPEGITYIGDGAFYGCTKLRGLKLPETLSSIGNEVFSDCYDLEAVCIPYALKETGYDTFYACDQLRYIFYPGPMSSFKALEIGELGPKTVVYCLDGTLTHEQ